MNKKIEITKENLLAALQEAGTKAQAAFILGSNESKISREMVKHGLTTRDYKRKPGSTLLKRPSIEQLTVECETMTAGQIATKRGVTYKAVLAWLEFYNLSPVQGRISSNKSGPPISRADLVDALQRHGSVKVAADELGYTFSQLKHYIRELKVSTDDYKSHSTRAATKRPHADELEDDCLTMTMVEIADKYSCTTRSVRMWLEHYGLQSQGKQVVAGIIPISLSPHEQWLIMQMDAEYLGEMAESFGVRESGIVGVWELRDKLIEKWKNVKLDPCPCGETPQFLLLSAGFKKSMTAKGSCCHTWGVDVNPSAQSVEAYAAAWNAAGRNTSAGKIKVVRCRSK